MTSLEELVPDPVLRFLANEAGEKEGLADAGIESFRDEPYASCAREAGQNSRDAANGQEGVPVKMSFNQFLIHRQSLPSSDLLRDAVDACKEKAEQERERDFFTNAASLLDREEISVLEISDFNTLGLLGPPDREGTPFHSLVKASGVTAKTAIDSGGSFGIGKNASFAVSDLQTVFYSTLYADTDTKQKEFAAQGKVKLVSHTDKSGNRMRATGYWGNPEGFTAVTDQSKVPEWMIRREIGTSIFCMGFRAAEGWAERITYSLISNFFCAINREEMEFEIDKGKMFINRTTLPSLLTRPDIVEASERMGHQADLTFAEQMYQCLVSDRADEKTLSIPDLGKVRVRILVGDGLPCRVGFIRNGMLITDNLRNFGHALARFPGSRDFVVIVEPIDTDAGVLLKKLENPTHDGFSAERIADLHKRRIATIAMRRLASELREIIRSTTGVTHADSVVLDELGKYFAESGKIENPSTPSAEDDPERYTYKPQRSKAKPHVVPTPTGGEQGGSNATSTSTNRNGGGGSRPGAGTGARGKGTSGEERLVVLRDVRNRIPPSASTTGKSRELLFSPEEAGLIQIILQATGVNAPDSLYVVKTDKGRTSSGKLIIEARANERCKATVELDEPYNGPIELVAVSDAEPSEVKP
ncbi:hypothetical protein KBZ12_17470 [Cyanobium sp. Cruz CV13-4-11]|uniref:hypothetical protein n=1 Tax=unclassified Cyanobium TaxID=2627006 RepID=UPI0020CC4457|nr:MULTISPECIES: hypothetical protein [unclassified Cyanobium]MCP9902360.1 hypothetical protein [Cyanobium sp. Cruz CV11-17]MCP9921230.1 hypothetical protein [Cyanobium sp. Cruz CV13-4-11]